jgi:serine phosphatase RsbU (regulator of sigma subunit)
LKQFAACLLFILSSKLGHSQNQVVVDSLRARFKAETTAEKKALILCDLSYEYRVVNPDSSLYYVQVAAGYTSKDTLDETYIKVLRSTSSAYIIKGNYEKAQEQINIVHRFYARKNDPANLAKTLLLEGNIYKYTSQTQLGISKYIEAAELFESLNDLSGMSNCYGMLGQLFMQTGDVDAALKYTLKEVEIARALGSDQKIGHSLTNLGIIYSDLEKYDDAITCYQNSIEFKKKLGDTLGVAINLSNLTSVYSKQGKLNEALTTINEALDITIRLNSTMWIAITEINKADVLRQLKRYDDAATFALNSLEKATAIEYTELISACYKALGEIYEESGNYKKAIEFLKKHFETESKMISDNSAKSIAEVTQKYESEKKDIEIEALNTDKKLKESEIARNKVEARQNEIQRYILFGGLALAILIGLILFNRFQVTQKQKKIIEQQKLEVDSAFEQLAVKNTEITDSILYAKRIQKAILPSVDMIQNNLPDSFILYKPKDIVAGDFYWMIPHESNLYFAAADCTGHGVPGAMVSVVCNGALNRSVKEFQETEPGKILDRTRQLVIEEFEKSDDGVNDGMDVSLIAIQSESGVRRIKWAGANNPLWILRKDADQIEEIKADKQPIGKFSNPKPFGNHSIQLNAGDTCYLFTDGFQDQFGGQKGKKFKASNLKSLLVSIQQKSMSEQKQLIEAAFETWRGALEQIDDVCIWGFRV